MLNLVVTGKLSNVEKHNEQSNAQYATGTLTAKQYRNGSLATDVYLIYIPKFRYDFAVQQGDGKWTVAIVARDMMVDSSVDDEGKRLSWIVLYASDVQSI